jgi:hypothetical protein
MKDLMISWLAFCVEVKNFGYCLGMLSCGIYIYILYFKPSLYHLASVGDFDWYAYIVVLPLPPF